MGDDDGGGDSVVILVLQAVVVMLSSLPASVFRPFSLPEQVESLVEAPTWSVVWRGRLPPAPPPPPPLPPPPPPKPDAKVCDLLCSRRPSIVAFNSFNSES